VTCRFQDRSARSHEGEPPRGADAVHAETHLAAGRDVLLTEDKPLRAMCRRLHDEHGFGIVAMRVNEYLAAR
jgi:erythromycin esterase-like protein